MLLLTGCRFDFDRAPGSVTPDTAPVPSDARAGIDGGAWNLDAAGIIVLPGCGDDVCGPGETETTCPGDCCLAACDVTSCSTCCRSEATNHTCYFTAATSCTCVHDCDAVPETCSSACSGAPCWTDCGAATLCVVDCREGTGCLMDCRDGLADCEMTCAGADCILLCGSSNPACRILSCSGDSRSVYDCGGGIFVCNATGLCPIVGL